jgi:hypothetical protein
MTTAGMEEIKDLVSHALEQKRVLSRLKVKGWLAEFNYITLATHTRVAGCESMMSESSMPRFSN